MLSIFKAKNENFVVFLSLFQFNCKKKFLLLLSSLYVHYECTSETEKERMKYNEEKKGGIAALEQKKSLMLCISYSRRERKILANEKFLYDLILQKKNVFLISRPLTVDLLSTLPDGLKIQEKKAAAKLCRTLPFKELKNLSKCANYTWHTRL